MNIADLPPQIRSKILVDDCWIWNGCCTSHGYGTVRHGGRMVAVHRVVYTLLVGPLPKGHERELHHTCKNKRCCNPEHLQLVTGSEHQKLEPRHMPKTHCPSGHPYDYEWHGNKACRICRNAASVRSKHRKKLKI